MIALPACGSDDNTDGTGTGGYGGASGSSGSAGKTSSGGTAGSGGTAPSNGGTTPGNGGTPGSGGAQSGGAAGTGTGGTAGAAGAGGAAAGAGGAAGAAGAGGSLPDAGSDASDASIEPDASTPDADIPDATVPPPDADAAPPDADVVACGGATILDITTPGTVSATSTSQSGSNNWRPTRVTDRNAATAWYGGNQISPVTFTWTHTTDDCITEIDTTNTAGVANRMNWGYESVVVRVLSSTGTQVFSQVISLAGTDPNLVIPTGGVVGRTVTLAFAGLEGDPKTTGGIAELFVRARR